MGIDILKPQRSGTQGSVRCRCRTVGPVGRSRLAIVHTKDGCFRRSKWLRGNEVRDSLMCLRHCKPFIKLDMGVVNTAVLE